MSISNCIKSPKSIHNCKISIPVKQPLLLFFLMPHVDPNPDRHEQESHTREALGVFLTWSISFRIKSYGLCFPGSLNQQPIASEKVIKTNSKPMAHIQFLMPQRKPRWIGAIGCILETSIYSRGIRKEQQPSPSSSYYKLTLPI